MSPVTADSPLPSYRDEDGNVTKKCISTTVPPMHWFHPHHRLQAMPSFLFDSYAKEEHDFHYSAQ